MLVAGCWLLVMLDAGWLSYWMLVSGCRLLVACHAGCWLLVILDVGCWLLVAGFWMLVMLVALLLVIYNEIFNQIM
jgi:hypothetical protein